MQPLSISALPAVMRPLANKFYRAHHSPMRAGADDQVWVAKHAEIVAALCLRPLVQESGFWLTSLLVAPAQRQQQIASRLVTQACERAAGPVWLFCHPELASFYTRLGFTEAENLPPSLAERLQRYCRTKTLIALHRDSQALASAS
ncbi:MAG: GNAT family N-acetyltransferase [Pseudomonas sp.]|uniref:GNAT family N-acetyltransferase n=1 Tax=Pseudomonas sp. TaxID=306 RepID=UPI0030F01475